MLFAAAHESPIGTSRQFVATHQFGRYRSEADMPRASRAGDLTEMTDTVEKVSAKKLWNWNLKRSNPGKWIFEILRVL